MGVTFTLLKKRGFKTNSIEILKTFLIAIGIAYPIIQVFESIYEIEIGGMNLVYIVIGLLLGVIIFICLKIHSLLLKNFELRDNYEVTISVGDYIHNTKKYPRATYVTGINNQFDIAESAIKKSLLDDLLIEFFYDENNEKKKKNEKNKEIRSDFEKKVSKRVENCDDNKLELNKELSEEQNVFKHGSIISEKFRYEDIPRNILFFANSSIVAEGEFSGGEKTASTLKLIWAHLFEENIKSDELLMPLLGTGLSRDITPMSATITIIDQFFAKSYPRRKGLLKYKQLVPHLVISIEPERIINNEVDLFAVHKYIEAMNERLEYGFTKETLYTKNIEDENKCCNDECCDNNL